MSNAALEAENIPEDFSEQVDPQKLADVRPIPRISIQAFCETQSVMSPVEKMTTDRRMANAQVRTHMGGLIAAIA